MSVSIFQNVSDLFSKMDSEYHTAANGCAFTCRNCEDTCCKSFFIHHTYLEWGYLKLGLENTLPEQKDIFIKKAKHYIAESSPILIEKKSPRIICPLNENGLCNLYQYRPMICRLHGVPSCISKPDDSLIKSPGCFRYEENNKVCSSDVLLDRTPFYKALASLEHQMIKSTGRPWPKIKMTIAEMIAYPLPFKYV